MIERKEKPKGNRPTDFGVNLYIRENITFEYSEKQHFQVINFSLTIVIYRNIYIL